MDMQGVRMTKSFVDKEFVEGGKVDRELGK
jgi:hypothetical protein